jgi:ATP/maltotriose-dependent transcriptional regulator MalT/DNA-binding SARP family transcriptional activator
MLADALEDGHALLLAGAGYGKTMALEEAIELADRRSVWLGCRDVGGEAGPLLVSAVEGLRATLPGLADVVGDRLASGAEPVDVRIATEALIAELERLLVEPLAIVFDDAEELEQAPAALGLVDRLLNARDVPLSVAIATRRPLPLKLAKLRAGGRLAEVGPHELSFTPGECEELLRLRHGRTVAADEVEAALTASEGWPMGVALTGLTESGEAVARAVPRDELFHYLAEEVLERLDPEMRLALVDSSVPALLTPGLAGALGLPPGFLDGTERLGLFMRTRASGARSYHPLFRSFLLQRLPEVRSEEERASLQASAAAAMVAAHRVPEAIDHWLAAGRPDEALSLLAANARLLVRTSPGAVGDWLARLPTELRDEPAYLLLEGNLLWGAGRHEEAIDPLRAAAAAFRGIGEEGREWVARLFLVDALLSVGAFEDIAEVGAGWEAVSDRSARETAAGVAWYQVISLAARGLVDEADALSKRLRADAEEAGRFSAADALARVGLEPAAGRSLETLANLRSTIAELERRDRYGSLPYLLAMVVLVLRDLGDPDAALEALDRCERAAERLGLGFVVRDCQLQRGFLLARSGELARAELELARAGPRRGTGWRGVHRHEAEAQVAALRGDGPEAVAAARRALDRVRPGALCYRVWTAVDMAPVLADNAAPEVARGAIEETLAALEERFEGDSGRLHRARLLASRACLEYDAGEADAACESLVRGWGEAGAEADQIVRVHWPRLQGVLWQALAEKALSPDAVLAAMQAAFPGGEALVAMVDHPDSAVRRAALATALAAGHPAVLERLGALADDADEQVAAAAAAAGERLRADPPPLRFELLGGFRVRRAGWLLEESAWQRPMAARVVRFLAIQGPSAVPEDALFEAFWTDRTSDSARQHLTVALSRARKVLDLPDAETSVIEARERTYRLRLGEHDSVDAAQFEHAAVAALAQRGGDRRDALERAAALWMGEPLPEDRYATWSFAWRERLLEAYSQVLSALVEGYAAAGEHHDAIRSARALLEVDPGNERAHRQLMVAYARTGRTSYALRQYLECRRALVGELGVEPSAETSSLQARILAGEPV